MEPLHMTTPRMSGRKKIALAGLIAAGTAAALGVTLPARADTTISFVVQQQDPEADLNNARAQCQVQGYNAGRTTYYSRNVDGSWNATAICFNL
jgi:hypothetical protein